MATGTGAAQDARAVLQAAAKNMGADSLRTVEITGTGMTAAVGQSFAFRANHSIERWTSLLLAVGRRPGSRCEG